MCVPYAGLTICILRGESKSASEILGSLMTLICNLTPYWAEAGIYEGNRGITRAAGQTNLARDAQRGAETKLS